MTVLSPSSTASSLDTWSGLKSAVSSWSHRSDLDSMLPNFLALVEANIRRDVRCMEMEETETGTLTSTTLALPASFGEMRRVLLGGYVQTYMTPNAWDAHKECTDGFYTILGANIHFQSGSSDYQIDYFKWFEPLVEDADSNWLLQHYPDVYLFGMLVEVAAFTKGSPDLYRARYAAAINDIRRTDNKARYAGPLTVRVA